MGDGIKQTKINVIVRGFTTHEIWEIANGGPDGRTRFNEIFTLYDTIIRPYAGKILQCTIDKDNNIMYGDVKIPQHIVFDTKDMARCNIKWVEGQ